VDELCFHPLGLWFKAGACACQVWSLPMYAVAVIAVGAVILLLAVVLLSVALLLGKRDKVGLFGRVKYPPAGPETTLVVTDIQVGAPA
jgi:hypothetical protein